MSYTKKDEFDEMEIKLAEFAKALSHPARIAILKFLYEKNICMCGEIVKVLPLSQSTVSQHLKELKKIGIIKGEIEGPKMCYCIDPEVLDEVMRAFSKLFKSICC